MGQPIFPSSTLQAHQQAYKCKPYISVVTLQKIQADSEVGRPTSYIRNAEVTLPGRHGDSAVKHPQ